jgi:heme/copper-type cytochrome/quinol oxidase subunit 1
MQKADKEQISYPKIPPPLPEYDISPELKKLVLMFMGAMLINFLIAGSLAIGMRIIQTDVPISKVDWIPQNVLWYALLTAHGQVMFFGVISANTLWFGYYAMSKWGRKPISGMKWAKASFWIMEAAVILIFIAALSGFGAGWYNLMPLTFLPGTPAMTWGMVAAVMFLVADLLVGIFLTIFCIVAFATLLRGKLPTGTQIFEYMHERDEKERKHEDPVVLENQDSKKVEQEFVHTENLSPSVRWISLLGINSWFPKKLRDMHPAVPIVLVSVFATALIQIVGNPGLFVQLSQGFISLQNPINASNWLLTKDAWWFFAHPIVYFPLLVFLGAIYFIAPRYSKERVAFWKWNYRTWPFYVAFSILVFSHHVFMDMPNPAWLQILSQTASLGIVWPSAMTIITILLFAWRGKVAWNITSRFYLAGLAGWMFGGFQGVETGMWGADIYLHNTMSMPGHIHLILLLGPLLFAFAIMYAILPDLTKKKMNKTLGEIHFWLTLFGGFGFALLFVVIGGQGAIRREASMPGAFDWAMPWLLFFALNIGIAQFIFVYNFVKTLRRKPTQQEIREYDTLHANPTADGITDGAP